MTAAQHQSGFQVTKDTPYLTLTGELCGIYCENCGQNWPCYNSTTLHISLDRCSLIMLYGIIELGHHWFRCFLMAQSHYLTQHWPLINRFEKHILVKFNSVTIIKENAVENFVCKMTTIFCWPQCIKYERDYFDEAEHFRNPSIRFMVIPFHYL